MGRMCTLEEVREGAVPPYYVQQVGWKRIDQLDRESFYTHGFINFLVFYRFFC